MAFMGESLGCIQEVEYRKKTREDSSFPKAFLPKVYGAAT
jgi:hypothetical protein